MGPRRFAPITSAACCGRPSCLPRAKARRRNEISVDELTRREDAAIREVVKLQEDLGLKAVTDGEFRRTLWHMDFLKQFANVVVSRSAVKVTFHTEQGDIEREPSALASRAANWRGRIRSSSTISGT